MPWVFYYSNKNRQCSGRLSTSDKIGTVAIRERYECLITKAWSTEPSAPASLSRAFCGDHYPCSEQGDAPVAMTSFRLLTKQEEKREQSPVAQGGHPSFSVEAREWQVQGLPGSFDFIFMGHTPLVPSTLYPLSYQCWHYKCTTMAGFAFKTKHSCWKYTPQDEQRFCFLL